MPNRRFFLPRDRIDLESGTLSIDDPGVVGQLRKVLRLKAGDEVVALDGAGWLYRCVLERLSPDRAEAKVVESVRACGDPPVRLAVALPLLKSDRFEWALQKLTELGVSEVVPVVSDRSVVRHKSDQRVGRWHHIAREAAEQCERATIPQVVSPSSLAQALANQEALAGAALRLVCAERRNAPSLRQVLCSTGSATVPPPSISLLIGPEGGLTDSEVELASEQGFRTVSLGPRILRSETAALYAVAQIVSHFEQ